MTDSRVSREAVEGRKALVLRLLAEALAGLQVPISLPGGFLGAAREPLVKMRQRDALDLFGYLDAAEIEAKLREVLKP